MKHVITFFSRKGGSGKTSSCLAIGGALQRLGESVLFVDLDAQCNLTRAMRGDSGRLNVTHLLDGSADITKVIQGTPDANGDLIPGSRFLAGADLVLDSDRTLKTAISPLWEKYQQIYDYILIDCPANYGRLTRIALAASTGAIITAQATTFSNQGLKEAAAIVEQMQQINDVLSLWGVIVTNYTGRGKIAQRLLDDIRNAARDLGTQVIEPPIKSTIRVVESQDAGINLMTYAPRSTAAECYMTIAEWILNTL